MLSVALTVVAYGQGGLLHRPLTAIATCRAARGCEAKHRHEYSRWQSPSAGLGLAWSLLLLATTDFAAAVTLIASRLGKTGQRCYTLEYRAWLVNPLCRDRRQCRLPIGLPIVVAPAGQVTGHSVGATPGGCPSTKTTTGK